MVILLALVLFSDSSNSLFSKIFPSALANVCCFRGRRQRLNELQWPFSKIITHVITTPRVIELKLDLIFISILNFLKKVLYIFVVSTSNSDSSSSANCTFNSSSFLSSSVFCTSSCGFSCWIVIPNNLKKKWNHTF